jgi:hypothetical protein
VEILAVLVFRVRLIPVKVKPAERVPDLHVTIIVSEEISESLRLGERPWLKNRRQIACSLNLR